jgi:hypothetical protein
MTAKSIAVRIGCALCSIWLAGCTISQPQSAAEFRIAAAGAQTAAKDTFEVNRPLSQWVHPSKGLRLNACPSRFG